MQMRKQRKRMGIFLSIMMLFSILFLSPVTANADEKYMNGESADISIVLDENGDAHIKEVWNCYFGGDTITRYRQKYKIPENAYTIDVENVSLDGEPLTLLDEPDESRPEGYAAVTDYEGGIAIEVYLNALDESHEICYEYTVKDAVILHDDIAEFRWVLSSDKMPFDVNELNGTIEIPYGTAEDGLYYWGHGPMDDSYFNALPEDGMVNQFELYVPYAPIGNGVSIRMAMPLEIFPAGSRYEAGEELDNIINEEKEYESEDVSGEADEGYADTTDPEERSGIARVMYRLGNVLLIGILPEAIFMIFVSPLIENFRKKRLIKKYRLKPEQSPDYYRSLPDDLKPALVHELTSFYEKDGQTVRKKGSETAAIFMDLVDRGFIEYQKKEDDHYFKVLKDQVEKKDEELKEHEKALIELIENAKNGEAVTIKDLNCYMKYHASTAHTAGRRIRNDVTSEMDELDYFQTKPARKMPKQLIFILWLLVTVCISYTAGTEFDGSFSAGIIFGICFGLLSTFFLTVIINSFFPEIRYYNQEGENKHEMWQAFARFLDDFTLFDEREVGDIKVWRRYLVYAVALGRSEKVMQQLKVKFPEIFDTVTSSGYFYDYDEMASSFYEMDQCLGYSITSSDNDSWSSSNDYDGGDGGFSSGGGDYDSGSDGGDFD